MIDSNPFQVVGSGIKAASRWASDQVRSIHNSLSKAGAFFSASVAGSTTGGGGKIGCFGPVVFETSLKTVRTPKNIHEQRRAKYAVHDVLSLEQKLQFVTIELARVELAMTFHRAFCVPDDELNALRGLLESHKAYDLTIGGCNYGKFVLEALTNEIEQVNDEGQTLVAEASVNLLEYR